MKLRVNTHKRKMGFYVAMSHQLPSNEEIEFILKQSPEWTTSVQISELWVAYNGNIPDILAKLWNVPNKEAKAETKWDNIRAICDAHDEEMNKLIKKMCE